MRQTAHRHVPARLQREGVLFSPRAGTMWYFPSSTDRPPSLLTSLRGSGQASLDCASERDRWSRPCDADRMHTFNVNPREKALSHEGSLGRGEGDVAIEQGVHLARATHRGARHADDQLVAPLVLGVDRDAALCRQRDFIRLHVHGGRFAGQGLCVRVRGASCRAVAFKIDADADWGSKRKGWGYSMQVDCGCGAGPSQGNQAAQLGLQCWEGRGNPLSHPTSCCWIRHPTSRTVADAAMGAGDKLGSKAEGSSAGAP